MRVGPTLLSQLHDNAHQVFDLLAPQTCVRCGVGVRGTGRPHCSSCHLQLSALSTDPVCPRCARIARSETIYRGRCGVCRREDFWNVAGVVRYGTYLPPLRELLARLKRHAQPRLANYLGGLLADALRRTPWSQEIDVFVPVPTHWQRRLIYQRGDQTALLAAAVARDLRRPVRRAVRRIRGFSSQIDAVSRAARFENVRGCFAPAWHAGVNGKTVCIVDNLLVSGATICEVAKALRKAGAKQIYAAVVARAAPAREIQPTAATARAANAEFQKDATAIAMPGAAIATRETAEVQACPDSSVCVR